MVIVGGGGGVRVAVGKGVVLEGKFWVEEDKVGSLEGWVVSEVLRLLFWELLIRDVLVMWEESKGEIRIY